MCDFNSLSNEEKESYHNQLMEVVEVLGSKNAFLQLLEDVRRSKKHPLVANNMKFIFSHGEIMWNKVVFQDKLALLLKVRTGESERENFLIDGDKKVLNLVRTLAPIKFTIKAKGTQNSYELHAFDKVDAKRTLLNPLFDAIFFCSIETVKKVLNFK